MWERCSGILNNLFIALLRPKKRRREQSHKGIEFRVKETTEPLTKVFIAGQGDFAENVIIFRASLFISLKEVFRGRRLYFVRRLHDKNFWLSGSLSL